jgi:D-hydroxyproline dehydrogenase subunit gamma
MSERFLTLQINGESVRVASGSSVAAALAIASASGGAHVVTRRSVSGAPRGPLCGMGICQECRVTIDGMRHKLACQTLCTQGMSVTT